MKFLKKSAIYFILIFFAIILGTTGYVIESRKNKILSKNDFASIPDKTIYDTPSAEIFVSDVIAEEKPPVKEISAPANTPTPAPQKHKKPVTGKIYREYSETNMIYSKTMNDFRTHMALDFVCNSGENVYATSSGIVSKIYTDSFLGLCLHITHSDGIITKYCSLSDVTVGEGENVTSDTIIAVAGSSAQTEANDGTHLHLEAEKNGKPINPSSLFK